MSVSSQIVAQSSEPGSDHMRLGEDGRAHVLTNIFQRTLLQCRSIHIRQLPALAKVPKGFFEIVEEKYQDLDKYAEFTRSVRSDSTSKTEYGRLNSLLFGLLSESENKDVAVRAFDPSFDRYITEPLLNVNLEKSITEPVSNSTIAFGFSSNAFTAAEVHDLPLWLAPIGIAAGSSESKQTRRKVCCPYFFLNSATRSKPKKPAVIAKQCSLEGAVALAGIQLLFDEAKREDSSLSFSSPAVFSCAIDNETIRLYHHWMTQAEFFMATVCVLSLNDSSHVMYFMGWLQAVENWAVTSLFPDIRKALNTRRSGAIPADAEPQSSRSSMHSDKRRSAGSPALPHLSRLVTTSPMTLETQTPRTPLAVTARMRPLSPSPSPLDPAPRDSFPSIIHPAFMGREELPTGGSATGEAPPSALQKNLSLTIPPTSARSPSPGYSLAPVNEEESSPAKGKTSSDPGIESPKLQMANDAPPTESVHRSENRTQNEEYSAGVTTTGMHAATSCSNQHEQVDSPQIRRSTSAPPKLLDHIRPLSMTLRRGKNSNFEAPAPLHGTAQSEGTITPPVTLEADTQQEPISASHVVKRARSTITPELRAKKGQSLVSMTEYGRLKRARSTLSERFRLWSPKLSPEDLEAASKPYVVPAYDMRNLSRPDLQLTPPATATENQNSVADDRSPVPKDTGLTLKTTGEKQNSLVRPDRLFLETPVREYGQASLPFSKRHSRSHSTPILGLTDPEKPMQISMPII